MAANEAGRTLIVPAENAPDVGLVEKKESLVAGNLPEVCAFLLNQCQLHPGHADLPQDEAKSEDLHDIIGQQQGKRALEVAAAGGHNLLLIGPPGTGKTMLAMRLIGLLPPLSDREALECATVASIINSGDVHKQWRKRPFRTPHHSSTLYALVGGGSLPQPVKSRWHIMVFYSLMSYPNLAVKRWMRCVSRLRQGNHYFTRPR